MPQSLKEGLLTGWVFFFSILTGIINKHIVGNETYSDMDVHLSHYLWRWSKGVWLFSPPPIPWQKRNRMRPALTMY